MANAKPVMQHENREALIDAFPKEPENPVAGESNPELGVWVSQPRPDKPEAGYWRKDH